MTETLTHVVTSRGHRIYVDPGDPRAVELVRAHGNLNPGSLLLWQRALDLHPWERIVDIGVNYGEMVVGPTFPAGAELIGFEPNPRIRPLLARTLAEAGIELDLRPQAVSARPGTARFAVDRTWSGTSALEPADQDPDRWTIVDVEVTTLDATLGDDPRSWCVKVDVEGFEREVIAGAARAMAAADHWLFMLEVLHMAPPYLAELASTYPVFLAGSGDELVRVLGETAEVSALLASGEVYPQDCLMISPSLAPRVTR